MSTYCVTFRIADKTVDGKTYSDRYQKLVDNVHTDDGYWDETTSFLLVTSSLTTEKFSQQASSGLSQKDDLVVVFDPGDMSCAYFGPLEHKDVLGSFFRVLKKAA
jgi:hypothetical protein|nr:hypothetical protein [Bradyrhizobium sp.]